MSDGRDHHREEMWCGSAAGCLVKPDLGGDCPDTNTGEIAACES